MQEVVHAEDLKLLQADIIYPISDSPWVSPTQVVSKKSRVTIMQNEKGEDMPTRLTTDWRVCIDYKRLNAVTRKDHFRLPFIDQLLERISRHPFYCFLDGYSGYFQIETAVEEQEKTTFTCSFGTYATREGLLASVMHLPHSKGVSSVFSVIWGNALWKCTWMTSPYMEVLLRCAWPTLKLFLTYALKKA